MSAPTFKNRPNQHLKYYYTDGCGLTIKQDFFISRATAVVGIVFALTKDGVYILTAKRSKKMYDEPNKVGVPCGYLDWDETRHEAMIREVCEETSLYLPDYAKHLWYNNNDEPIVIKDNPASNKRQNISHIYLTVLDFTESMFEMPFDIETFSCKETEWVKWMKLETFYLTCVNYQWAFSHDETIKNAIKFYNEKFSK
jgi:8-oxo-dGTP pyrophosphatase MutT (NUDIX family)